MSTVNLLSDEADRNQESRIVIRRKNGGDNGLSGYYWIDAPMPRDLYGTYAEAMDAAYAKSGIKRDEVKRLRKL